MAEPTIELTQTGPWGMPGDLLKAWIVDRPNTMVHSGRWCCCMDPHVVMETLASMGYVVELCYHDADGECAIFATKEMVAIACCIEVGAFSYTVGGDDRTMMSDLARLEGLGSPLMAPEGDVYARYWGNGPFGPTCHPRPISTPSWATVRGNYPTATQGQLDRLMAMGAPQSGGKLVLLHGPPGTGKTFSVRALAEAWKSWCSLDVIIDADEFFQHASYLMTVLMEYNDPDAWKLLVIEDADEFVSGKQRTQQVSRLLNVTDGLVGQGCNVIVLMSTNAPMDTFDAAITRPGRCMATIEFPPFSATEAAAWLDENGCDVPLDDREHSLAELHAILAAYADKSREQAKQARAMATLLAASNRELAAMRAKVGLT